MAGCTSGPQQITSTEGYGDLEVIAGYLFASILNSIPLINDRMVLL